MLLNDFYTIESLASQPDGVTAIIKLDPDHAIYQGHFQGNPVVPGVCLMTISKEVLAEAIDRPLQLREAKSLKFLRVVNPKVQPVLKVVIEIKEQTGDSIRTLSQITDSEDMCYKAICTFQTQR